MYKGMLALGLAGAVLACGGGGGGFDGILTKARSFKDKVCACKDQACVDGVHADMKVAFEQAQSFKGKPTKDQQMAWAKIRAEARACEAAVADAGGASKAAAVIAAMRASKDKACACTDAACGDKLVSELAAQAAEMAAARPTAAQQQELLAISDELTRCIARAARPADPADPSAPAAPAAPVDPTVPAAP